VAAAVAAEPSFKEYTDEKDNWPEQKKDEKIAEPVVLVKGPVEPVKPVKEVKLEVEITEPVKEEKQEPEFTVEETLDTDELAEKLVAEQGFTTRLST
jgi:S-DNA-T family DNA segregation ATPase FtsK/SpoIIIE